VAKMPQDSSITDRRSEDRFLGAPRRVSGDLMDRGTLGAKSTGAGGPDGPSGLGAPVKEGVEIRCRSLRGTDCPGVSSSPICTLKTALDPEKTALQVSCWS
jgi:hypothetical protein